jgi:hypothetical protein
MTDVGTFLMGLDSHRPRNRLAEYLSRQYRGAHRTKALAGDVGCTPKAAENILNGHWPNDLHFAAIVRRFGRDVLDAIFLPEIDPVLARLAVKEAELDRALQAARARRRQVEGARFSNPITDQGDLFAAEGASE